MVHVLGEPHPKSSRCREAAAGCSAEHAAEPPARAVTRRCALADAQGLSTSAAAAGAPAVTPRAVGGRSRRRRHGKRQHGGKGEQKADLHLRDHEAPAPGVQPSKLQAQRGSCGYARRCATRPKAAPLWGSSGSRRGSLGGAPTGSPAARMAQPTSQASSHPGACRRAASTSASTAAAHDLSSIGALMCEALPEAS